MLLRRGKETPNLPFPAKTKNDLLLEQVRLEHDVLFLKRFAPCSVVPDSFLWLDPPAVFPVSDDGNFSFAVTQAKHPGVIPQSTGQEILLAPPSTPYPESSLSSPHPLHHPSPSPGLDSQQLPGALPVSASH